MAGEQQGRLFMAEAGVGDLAQVLSAAAEAHLGFENARAAVAMPDVVQPNACPVLGRGVAQALQHADRSAAESQEADAAGVQQAEQSIGGKAGVEHEFGGWGVGALLDEVDEGQDSLVLVFLLDRGIGEAMDAGIGVSGNECADATLRTRSLGNVMALYERLVAVEGDDMEVEVKGLAAGQVESLGGIEPLRSEGGSAACSILVASWEFRLDSHRSRTVMNVWQRDFMDRLRVQILTGTDAEQHRIYLDGQLPSRL